MDKVYANSLFNVGALDSTNTADGQFQTRKLAAIDTKILWSPEIQDGHGVFYIMSLAADPTESLYTLQKSALL